MPKKNYFIVQTAETFVTGNIHRSFSRVIFR